MEAEKIRLTVRLVYLGNIRCRGSLWHDRDSNGARESERVCFAMFSELILDFPFTCFIARILLMTHSLGHVHSYSSLLLPALIFIYTHVAMTRADSSSTSHVFTLPTPFPHFPWPIQVGLLWAVDSNCGYYTFQHAPLRCTEFRLGFWHLRPMRLYCFLNHSRIIPPGPNLNLFIVFFSSIFINNVSCFFNC